YALETSDALKRIRGEAGRYCRARKKLLESRSRAGLEGTLEKVVATFLAQHADVDYSPALVILCGPFAFAMSMECDVYYCFERLMSQLDDHFATHDINERMSNFLMLFRTLLPDLYSHFEEEEVDFKAWAQSWLTNLLAKELPLDCLLRLWDTYFSTPDGLTLHVYVCLAMLSYCKDSLEELEQSEINSMLARLPSIDMDQASPFAFYL
ncbi:rab-GTPase-TBC domain-containing protein, partial [Blyttiomyces helicus]